MTDYSNLLSFFDPKKFNHEELSKIIDMVITKVKVKGGNHQAGCAWVVMLLYKNGKCNLVQVDELIDQFNEYCKGYDNYTNSLTTGINEDTPHTYYNGFLHKKIKGD